MSYIRQGENVLTSTAAESDTLGRGQLAVTERRVVFQGQDGEVADISLDRIDGMDYYTGEGWTDDALVGLTMAVVGFLGLMASSALPQVQAVLGGVSVLVVFVGVLIAAIYYDRTKGLRVHTGAKTWAFEGEGLREFPHAVRAAR